jgi:hypothetical protein
MGSAVGEIEELIAEMPGRDRQAAAANAAGRDRWGTMIASSQTRQVNPMVLSPLSELVERIRSDMNLTGEVPGFDPLNGNEQARFLFVLEAPGAKAVKTGCISFDNPDQTARNFKAHLTGAGIERADIAIWNIVPWYLGNQEGTRIRAATAADTKQGLKYWRDARHEPTKLTSYCMLSNEIKKLRSRSNRLKWKVA